MMHYQRGYFYSSTRYSFISSISLYFFVYSMFHR